MYIEKDLEKIKRTARNKENENIKFRSFLKTVEMKSAEIDSVVHKIYKDVIEHIDCTECANCCNVKKPTLDNNDIKKFVNGLEIKEEEFRKNYLTETTSDENKKVHEFNILPCPFLKNNLCSNYDNRPKDCEAYPHLTKSEFTSRLWGVIDNYEICPIVFNVFEDLKNKLWRRRYQDQ